MIQIGDKYGGLTIIGQSNSGYECRCKCGKTHVFTEKTIMEKPKYCYYPIFISSRLTYSTKASNATYRKRKKYQDLENVILVESRRECMPSDEYCELWNEYKRKQLNKKSSKEEEKEYSIVEYNNRGKRIGTYKIMAGSHLGALGKLYPQSIFELCPQSDIHRSRGSLRCGIDYDFVVSSHFNVSNYSKTRYYKKVDCYIKK